MYMYIFATRPVQDFLSWFMIFFILQAPKEVFDASVTPSMRKGAVADWKNHFTQAHHDYLDKQIKDKLADTGLTFTFELKE